VAANTEEVELFVNGKSLGRARPVNGYLFTFPDVVWEPGEIKAVAYAGGKAVATAAKSTAGAPVRLRMTAITGPGGLRADGSDIALIDVEAVDASGRRAPTFQQRVDFEISGPGVWRGGYNSGKIKSTNNLYVDLEAGINRVAVRATRESGVIIVKAAAKGLAPAAIEIAARRVSDPPPLPELPVVDLPKERVAPAPAPARKSAASGPAQLGRYVKSFSYSGPAGGVRVQPDASEGDPAYTDSAAAITKLPPELQGADYIQAAHADRAYSAVDLMEIAVKAGATVYVAHDDRLPRPAWLTRQFEPTALSIAVQGKPMKIYRRRAAADESLTLGSNAEGAAQGNMFVVFVK
jgi:beta-galactosidase